jgi:hypothetical protein
MSRWQAWDARLRTPGPWHTRLDHPDGAKEVVWGRRSPRDGLGDHRLEDLVYGGELVARAHPDSLIVLTEGERAADAVRDAGYIGVGTVCGASAMPGDAVLSLFRGHYVALWPDADAVGARHMYRIAGRLEQLGGRTLVSLVTWNDAADGADAADTDSWTITRLITSARLLPILAPHCTTCGEAIAS